MSIDLAYYVLGYSLKTAVYMSIILLSARLSHHSSSLDLYNYICF